jgi:hypothetical protein
MADRPAALKLKTGGPAACHSEVEPSCPKSLPLVSRTEHVKLIQERKRKEGRKMQTV